jgi:ATP-dependent DNA helicase DinG
MARPKPELPPSLPKDPGDLDYLLAKGGPLDGAWDGFEPREAQLAMLRQAAWAFTNGETSVIEAGTGTGKTMAYLLPALISGKKTFVSTGLKNLQEQIFHKDLRFIRDHFRKEFTAVVLKGRENYLCKRLLHSIGARIRSSLIRRGEDTYAILKRWAEETETGELEELSVFEFGALDPPFDRLSSSANNCLGQACPAHGECFVTRIRRLAAESDMVLVNHHLFMADLALKRRGVGFLPDWEAVVLDEAHLIMDVASDFFSHRSSTSELQNTGKSLEQAVSWELQKEGLHDRDYENDLNDLKALAESIEEFSLHISNRFSQTMEETILWPKGPEGSWDKRDRDFKILLGELRDRLEDILGILERVKESNDDFKTVFSDLSWHFDALDFIAKNDDDSFVYQVKSDRNTVTLEAVPIDIAPFLSRHLFERQQTIIVCSATLSTGGNLDYFMRKSGIPPQSRGLVLSSPFDYAENTILYIPNNVEPPQEGERNPQYDQKVVEQIFKLIGITEGRALVLFTSFRQMYMVRDALLRMGLDYNLFCQEPGIGRRQLLEDFWRDFHSVLLATQSFWQGVDIQGQSLSAVIIDKIPFPRPTTPLVRARLEVIDRNKGNRFQDFFIPEATLNLKQGLGRLIRRKSDWGLLALLDSRIHHKQYGPRVLEYLGLPRKILTSRLSDVQRFFNFKNAQF